MIEFIKEEFVKGEISHVFISKQPCTKKQTMQIYLAGGGKIVWWRRVFWWFRGIR